MDKDLVVDAEAVTLVWDFDKPECMKPAFKASLAYAFCICVFLHGLLAADAVDECDEV